MQKSASRAAHPLSDTSTYCKHQTIGLGQWIAIFIAYHSGLGKATSIVDLGRVPRMVKVSRPLGIDPMFDHMITLFHRSPTLQVESSSSLLYAFRNVPFYLRFGRYSPLTSRCNGGLAILSCPLFAVGEWCLRFSFRSIVHPTMFY